MNTIRKATMPDGSERYLHTGLVPTPRHLLAAAEPFLPPVPLLAAAPRPVVVPPSLEMWLNDQYGDCVTAEEAAAIAFYSVMLGQAEVRITDATVLAFCNQYGFLNGAMPADVMDRMMSDGFHQDGVTYRNGPHAAVNYGSESVLQAALEQGPVKIGIDAAALPREAGTRNGWYAFGGAPQQFRNYDHCVAVWNYGGPQTLFGALGASVPSGAPASLYHVFTWGSVGVVDHAWLMSTCSEAWVRTPTDTAFGPEPAPPAPPVPTPPPAPSPPAPGPSVRQVVDRAFADLIAQSRRPAVRAILQQVQALVDSWLAAHGYTAAAGPPGTVREVVDEVFTALESAETTRPLIFFGLQMAQTMIDGWLAAHGY